MGLFDFLRSKKAETPEVARNDGWANVAMGYGTSRDRSQGTEFKDALPLSDGELASLFYNEPIAHKIVCKRLGDAFRSGYELGESAPKDLAKKLQKLQFKGKFLEAWTWGALYGGALLIFWDGQAPQMPLKEDAEIKNITVVDRRFLRLDPAMYETDVGDPNFGQPRFYGLCPNGTPGDPAQAVSAYVHASRVIRFGGALTDPYERMAKLAGWDYSVLQRPYDTLAKVGISFKSASVLLEDSGQAIYYIQNLINMIAKDPAALQVRMAWVDQLRSTGRAILLDAEKEKFERHATPFAGVADTLDRLVQFLASACDLPVSLLMGRAPAGLNATGESETRAYYDTVGAMQENEIQPKFVRAIQTIAGGESNYSGEDFEWCELWEQSDKERAEVEKLEADTWKVYIDAGVLLPEEVKLEEFGEQEIEVDTAELEAEIKAASDRAKEMASAQHEAGVATSEATAENAGQDMPMMGEDQTRQDGRVNRGVAKPFVATVYGHATKPVLTVHPEDNVNQKRWIIVRHPNGNKERTFGISRAPSDLAEAARQAHAAGDTASAKAAAFAATDPDTLAEAAAYHAERGAHHLAAAAKAGPSQQERDELGRFA